MKPSERSKQKLSPAGTTRHRSGRFYDGLAILVLTAGIFLVYWPATTFDFVNFDDPIYVVQNQHVRAGITWESLKWAWTANVAANWSPVTLVSHMFDCEIFGAWGGGHHLTNLLLHAANSALLFILLFWPTGKRLESFSVAALFAWHPLHVESVAWVAERKDVLSTFFEFLALLCYLLYTRKSPTRSPIRRNSYYALAVLFFGVGLMAKPMIVTLPFVLLLLDYWPLRRVGKDSEKPERLFGHARWSKLVLEKLPFLALAGLSCGITVWAQRAGNAVVAVQALPITARLEHSLMSYWDYIGMIFWPAKMAAYYPYVAASTGWLFWVATSGLVFLTIVALIQRRFPWLTVGWLWFLGTLVPVIGLVQVGGQDLADRYAYVPSIGLFIPLVFGTSQLATAFRQIRPVVTLAGLATAAACLAITSQQVWHWRNSETLFRHAIAVTKNNYAAYNNLGVALESQRKFTEALDCYKKAVLYFPGYADAHSNMGHVYQQLKQHRNSIAEYQSSLAINPKDARTHFFFGNELLETGDLDDAVQNYQIALVSMPDHSDIHFKLATALMARGEVEQGRQEYREVLKLAPDWLEALNNLAWSLASDPDPKNRNAKEALQLATHAMILSKTNDPGVLDTVAVADAANGNFSEAIKTANQALVLARASSDTQMAKDIESRMKLYEKSQCYFDLTPPPAVPPPGAKVKKTPDGR